MLAPTRPSGAELAGATARHGICGRDRARFGRTAGDTAAALAAAGAAQAPSSESKAARAGAREQLDLAKSPHAAQVMQRTAIVAAGEFASGFQHSLNNPLTGILAEAQLMQLESANPEQHAALERIVVLCRRIMELGKSVDGMGERK